MSERIDSADVKDCKIAFPSTAQGVDWDRRSLVDDVLDAKSGSRQFNKQEELASKWHFSNSSNTARRAEVGAKCGDLIKSELKEKERQKDESEEFRILLKGANDVLVSGIVQHFENIAIYPLHGSSPNEQDLRVEAALKGVLPGVTLMEMSNAEIKSLKHVGTSSQQFTRNAADDSTKWIVATNVQTAKALLKN